jgi:hypothetical protein
MAPGRSEFGPELIAHLIEKTLIKNTLIEAIEGLNDGLFKV